MRKDDEHPTLESGANTPAVDPDELDNPEYTRFEEAAARRKAVGLYNQVWGTRHDVQSAIENVYITGSTPRLANAITVGTDCSGIETPIQALEKELSLIHI